MGRIRPTLHGSQLRNAKLTLEEKAALAQKYGYPGLDFGLNELQNADGAAMFARYGVAPFHCRGHPGEQPPGPGNGVRPGAGASPGAGQASPAAPWGRRAR